MTSAYNRIVLGGLPLYHNVFKHRINLVLIKLADASLVPMPCAKKKEMSKDGFDANIYVL